MSLDDMRDLGESFGAVLRQSLEELEKTAELRGGGLRHGDVEWQVSYFFDGLRRVLLFDLAEATATLVTVSSQAIATDDAGSWASAVAGSTSLPRQVLQDQLDVLVRQVLTQARFVANTLTSGDMRPVVLGAMDGEEMGA